MKHLPYLLILTLLTLIACNATPDGEKAKKVVTIDNLKKHVEYLSSDLCEGRKPFSKGAERAVEYLAQEMKSIGLKPIQGDSYLQEVPLAKAAPSHPPGAGRGWALTREQDGLGGCGAGTPGPGGGGCLSKASSC